MEWIKLTYNEEIHRLEGNLPKVGDFVLLSTVAGWVTCGVVREIKGMIYFFEVNPAEVNAWMPMPKAYIEEKTREFDDFCRPGRFSDESPL